MIVTIDEVLHFWFGDDPDDAAVANARGTLWWSKDEAIDHEIRRRFEPSVLAAESATLSDWQATPQGRLALVLLTDQFPRNIYRDTPDAFRFDPIARQLCLDAIAAKASAALRPIHRAFLYMPLEHAEDLAHQNMCVDLFAGLVTEVPGHAKSAFTNFLEHAKQHRQIIQHFGRFPHRNAILGRESSAEERAFLGPVNTN